MSSLYRARSDVVHGEATREQTADLVPVAEDILRTILDWHLKFALEFSSKEEIIHKLDEAMVDGGRSLAASYGENE